MRATEKFPERWLETEPLIGGALCLDFANTVTWRAGSSPIERLTRYEDLVRWLRRSDALSAGDAVGLIAQCRKTPRAAAKTLERALALREVIYRLFLAIAQGRTPASVYLAGINKLAQGMSARLAILARGDRYALDWAEKEDLEQALWPLLRSTIQLLTSDELASVRECAGENCGWLFVDRSRNHLRRWCSMQDCGNRFKAREHYKKSQLKSRRSS